MRFDAIIVGAGIIGCTCAGYLARAGLKVAVLDSAERATGTTSRSFAWANASSKINDRAYHALNASGVRAYTALAAEFGGQKLGIRPTGAIFTTSQNDAVGLKDLEHHRQALEAFGYPSEMLDTAALRAAEPDLTIPDTTIGLLARDDLIIDAPKFSRFMLNLALAAGGTLHENIGPLELMADDNGVVSGVTTGQGLLASDTVIVATGQHTPETLAMLTGYDGFTTGFPLQKAPGLLLTTPPLPASALPHHVIGTSPAHEVHFLPAFNGGVKIGSDDIDGLILEDHSSENLKRAGQLLLDRAAAWLPALADVAIDDCRLDIGVRPYPQDGKSILGALPGSKGLFVLATHSGITLAPVIGQYMADVLTGQTPAFDATPYSLSRFSGF